MNGPFPEPSPPLPSEVEIILSEEPAVKGFIVTTQRHRTNGGKLVAIAPPQVSWRPATDRETGSDSTFH